MARGRTLWEMFVDWLSGPRELQHFNPLRARIGASVTIDAVEWRDRDFILREIRVTKRRISGQEFVFADYGIVERTTKGEETRARVRLNPAADARHTGEDHHALLLFREDEMGYDEAFHEVVADPTGIFRIENDGEVEAEFTRLHGLKEPYKAVVTVLADEDHNKRIDRDEVRWVREEYWDFEQDVEDAPGVVEKEYLFVELDTVDGWFELWRGRPIDPRKITIV